MADKIRCAGCDYCEAFQKVGSKCKSFYCKHPDQSYILAYFKNHRVQKAPGFIGYGRLPANEIPIKTSPAWCPKKISKEKEKNNDSY